MTPLLAAGKTKTQKKLYMRLTHANTITIILVVRLKIDKQILDFLNIFESVMTKTVIRTSKMLRKSIFLKPPSMCRVLTLKDVAPALFL